MKINKIIQRIALGVSLAVTGIVGCDREKGLESKINSAPATQQIEVTEANRLLKEFPDKIPGAAEVRKYETIGAKYTLVHVLQTHGFSIEAEKKLKDEIDDEKASREFIREMYCEVNESQRNILNIASFLTEKGYYLIWQEGLQEEVKAEDLRRLYLINSSRIGREYFPEEFKNKDFDKFAFTGGGVNLLASRGKVKILPIDKAGLNNKVITATLEELNSGKINPNINDIQERREDLVINTIAESNKPLSIINYGRAHSFGGAASCGIEYELFDRVQTGDNIANWNAINPDRKFSLIEIVPSSYKN